MKVLKPAWVKHDGLPIFAIDVHPDGTRFATGGQGNNTGGRISIWNMVPCLEEQKSKNDNIPKLLCELEFHACVNALRWSQSGQYLSSGGDDRIVEIWKCVVKYNGSSSAPTNNPFVKASHEQWRSVATLNGHTGDILHVEWSPNDKYLASASVDNTVIIWDAVNFPYVVATLKGHSSLVKGVTWDPVGKFLASQSDDRTLRIWRTSDWQLEHVVKEPFLECGGTTHVLRLDWSPDGLYLVSAHAMNAGGPVAQIVERTGWKTDKDFVGHRKAVVCVRFNRNILVREGNKSKTCFVALGSRDRCVSVWSAALKRPLVVLRDLFTSSIMDLSWSTCGTILTCCSFDGTVAIAQFATSEIGKPISTNEVVSLHQQTYGNNIMSTTCNLIQDISILKGQISRQNQNQAASALADADALTSNSRNKDKETNGNTNSSAGPAAPNKSAEPDKFINSSSSERGDRDRDRERERDRERPEISPTSSATASTGTTPATSDKSNSSSPAKGPLYKQIETVRNDGKRRITPQFLLPQDGSASGKPEENNISKLGNDITSATTSGAPQNAQNSVKADDGGGGGAGPESALDSSGGENAGAGNLEDDPTKNSNTISANDRAALLEARVTDSGTVTKEKDIEPASISKPRISTGSGSSTSDASSAKTVASSTEKSTNLKVPSLPPPPPPSGQVSGSQSQLATSTVVGTASGPGSGLLAPGSAVIKRKRSVEEADGKSKKGKPISLNGPSAGGASMSSSAPKTLPPQLIKSKEKQVSAGFSTPAQPTASGSNNNMPYTGEIPGAGGKLGGRSKLAPMKLEVTMLQVYVKKTGGYTLAVENDKKVGRYSSHSLTCTHEKESLDGLSWTVCFESRVIGMVGDAFRSVALCEDSTCHILDTKGRYSLPPFVLPNFPHSFILREQYLMVITTKASIHMWNVHTKKNVIRSESLLPLLNQNCLDPRGRPVEISRSTILLGGVPLIILSNGKSYKFSQEMSSWMLFLSAGPKISRFDMDLSDKAVGDKLTQSHVALWNGNGVRDVNYAAVSDAKLRLAGAIELKKSADVRTCMHGLGLVLAREGLESELRHLFLDLLGPCHSNAAPGISSSEAPGAIGTATTTTITSSSQNSNSAVSVSNGTGNPSWNPLVIGVPKRAVLRSILNDILKNLRWQDLYCEFNELLERVEGVSTEMEVF